MKKSINFVFRTFALACLVMPFVTNAKQTVQPVKDTAGTAFSGSGTAWTGNAVLGSVVTIIGRYTTDGNANESGLGLKVIYNEAQFTGVTVTALSTKCMIAAPQVQSGGASTKAVMGWLDTAARSQAGSVGWPYLADPATSTGSTATSPCLSPGLTNDTTATAPGPVNLFQFQGTLASSVRAGDTAVVSIVADGNVSYASASPGMDNQAVTFTAVSVCNLDVDNSGSSTAFVDGILIVRYLLNLTGSDLTRNVNITGTRSIPADLITFMSSLNWDVTGAGASSAFRDGIILVRLMLRIPDRDLLTNVTIPPTATFQTAAQIRANVNAMCASSF